MRMTSSFDRTLRTEPSRTDEYTLACLLLVAPSGRSHATLSCRRNILRWLFVSFGLLAPLASAFGSKRLQGTTRRLLLPLGYNPAGFSAAPVDASSHGFDTSNQKSMQQYRPIPVMPSQLFQQLALSQLELLASSLPAPGRLGVSKIKSMSLYLPQENVNTGQLEFLPAVLFPDPGSERVFIASEADSGVAPTLPRTLTKLPGFAHATSLLPGYPMVSSNTEKIAGVGAVEEVMCDLKASNGAAALSVPLFAGSQTVGVLLVSPSVAPRKSESVWTKEDREQVARAAQSLSLALSMDSERAALQMQNEQVRDALSDSLHQIKNPLQALRTYGKLLQQRIADVAGIGSTSMTPQLLELAEHLMVQSDRLVDRLKPVDAIVDSLEPQPLLTSGKSSATAKGSLARWRTPFLPRDREAVYFSRGSQSDGADPVIFGGTTATPQRGSDKQRPNGGEGAAGSFSTGGESRSNGKSRSIQSSLVEDVELEMSFVSDVLQPILSAFRAIAIDRDISFVVEESDELPGVSISPQALQEAVSNVIDNSFKYVVLPKPWLGAPSRNLAPMVRVRLSPNSNALAPGVTILVEDNGPGIRLEDRSAIFERGYRAAATSSVSGTGLGLNIALSLIQTMGGTLEVCDEGGYVGATTKFVLFRNPVV